MCVLQIDFLFNRDRERERLLVDTFGAADCRSICRLWNADSQCESHIFVQLVRQLIMLRMLLIWRITCVSLFVLFARASIFNEDSSMKIRSFNLYDITASMQQLLVAFQVSWTESLFTSTVVSNRMPFQLSLATCNQTHNQLADCLLRCVSTVY